VNLEVIEGRGWLKGLEEPWRRCKELETVEGIGRRPMNESDRTRRSGKVARAGGKSKKFEKQNWIRKWKKATGR
jgi:hypothetical protein